MPLAAMNTLIELIQAGIDQLESVLVINPVVRKAESRDGTAGYVADSGVVRSFRDPDGGYEFQSRVSTKQSALCSKQEAWLPECV